ncbi:MAG: type VI secretion system baseplate subunit TssG [Gemmataceae bacterium]
MPEPTVEERLYAEPFRFDFYQAVRLLQRLSADRVPVGLAGPPGKEAVRFKALPSLSFPASALYSLTAPTAEQPVPTAVVTFLGMHGPSGVLPRHYTEMIMRLERDQRGEERRALRDWLDLFNHRFISLLHRAWEKYRFWPAYERGEDEPFTRALYCLVGMGTGGLRDRLRVEAVESGGEGSRVLAKVEDQALLYYAGLFATRRRTAAGLRAMLADYFGVPVSVEQFVGQWLVLGRDTQSALGVNATLGVDAVAGEKVRDVQGKFRVTLGPLTFRRFLDFLPDRTPVPEHKGFWLACHLTRLYAGPELEFEVCVVLRADSVPECELAEDGPGARLGWNAWLTSQQPAEDATDARFDGEEMTRVYESS